MESTPTTADTPDETPTPRPTRTPTPEAVLKPNAIWIAADGPGTAIIEIMPDGALRTIPLPLNEGQTATDATSSRDGRRLAYLVWEDGAQKGIASWTLIEPNARLIALPQPGYRVISMLFSEDGETLLFVQTDAAAADSADQHWRLEGIPAGGGESNVILDQDTAPDIVWPLPLGWPDPEGPIYLHASARYPDRSTVLAGVYGLDQETGDLLLVTPAEDALVIDAVLSPDGRRIAYLPGHGAGKTDVFRVHDLDSLQTTTMTPPGGGVAISAAWMPDGALLLDYVTSVDDPATQRWARAVPGSTAPFPETAADPDRRRLFMYTPYEDGIVYSLYPALGESGWKLYILPEIGPEAEPRALSMEEAGDGAARIIYVP